MGEGAPPQTNQDPQSYTEVVAAHPGMHPNLHDHVTRLAQDANESGSIQAASPLMHATELASHLTRNKSESTLELDSTYGKALLATLDMVDWENVSAAEADKLLGTVADFDAVNEPLAWDHETVAKTSFMNAITGKVPAKILAELYAQNDEQTGSRFQAYVTNRELNSGRAAQLGNTLHRIYSQTTGEAVVLFPEGKDANVDRLREHIDFTQAHIDYLPDGPENPYDQQEVYEYEKTMRAHAEDIILNKLHLNQALKDKMGTAMSLRLLDSNPEGGPPYISGEKMKKVLSGMKRITEGIAPTKLERLVDELGIVNLDMYEPSDLETLNELLDKDERAIAHLKTGDVTVVFVDAYGDHNGAFTEVFNAYRNNMSQRTLMFEVGKPGDFYRRMVMLKRLGIKPSTVVIGAHGSPGQTHFGQGDGKFVLTANKHVASMGDISNNINLDETQLARLASDEFMQPSRGIDDPGERKGRRTIIFNSCSSDLEFLRGMPSTVETAVRTINRADVDAYGAISDMYLGHGQGAVFFKGKFTRKDGTESYTPNGSRVSVDENPSRIGRMKTKMQSRDVYSYGQKVSDDFRNMDLPIRRTFVQHIQLDRTLEDFEREGHSA